MFLGVCVGFVLQKQDRLTTTPPRHQKTVIQVVNRVTLYNTISWIIEVSVVKLSAGDCDGISPLSA
jgi:hypothetical protein